MLKKLWEGIGKNQRGAKGLDLILRIQHVLPMMSVHAKSMQNPWHLPSWPSWVYCLRCPRYVRLPTEHTTTAVPVVKISSACVYRRKDFMLLGQHTSSEYLSPKPFDLFPGSSQLLALPHLHGLRNRHWCFLNCVSKRASQFNYGPIWKGVVLSSTKIILQTA